MKKEYKIIYETGSYAIRIIPLNYRIDIKSSMIPLNPNAGIERDWYSPLDWSSGFNSPMGRAIWVAEEACSDHFRLITKDEIIAKNKRCESMVKVRLARRNKLSTRSKHGE